MIPPIKPTNYSHLNELHISYALASLKHIQTVHKAKPKSEPRTAGPVRPHRLNADVHILLHHHPRRRHVDERDGPVAEERFGRERRDARALALRELGEPAAPAELAEVEQEARGEDRAEPGYGERNARVRVGGVRTRI